MQAMFAVESSLDHDGDSLVRYELKMSNGDFSASVAAWGNLDHHLAFASALEGFPKTASAIANFRFGSPGTGTCQLDFSCLDGVGHIGIWADFESTYPVRRSTRHESALLFMACDPASIDGFVADLRRFVAGSANRAQLGGFGP